MLIAVLENNCVVLFIIIFGTLSFTVWRDLCVCLLDATMSFAKAAELIEMSFGEWTRVDPSYHPLGVGTYPRYRTLDTLW